MKISSFKQLSALMLALMLTPAAAMLVQAQTTSEDILLAQRAIREPKMIEGNRPPSISNSGILNSAQDHYFDILVSGEPLNRLEVQCVTFHELDEAKVLDPATGKEIPHTLNYGFEEFAVTFDEPIPVGQEVRILMEGSTVRGVTTGIIVPYRIFGTSEALGTIPLGTALVRGPSEN
ncbi:MAG: hypothetical protein AAGF83_22930 [Cyanobacteria bacterium P01_G01_bin.67]